MDVREKLRFAAFELDLQAHELLRNGRTVKVAPQALRLLEFLAANPGRLVTREEIRQEIWSETTFVDFEQGINKSIRQIRDALNDDADRPRFIETLPRRGYRFIANIEYPKTEPVEAHMDEPNRAAPASFATETPELAESRPRILTRPRVLFGVAARQFPRAAQAHLEKLPEAGAPGITSLPAKPERTWRSRAGLAIAAVALLALLASAAWFYRVASRGGETIDSVAVLPFVNASGDPNAEYLSDGITESLINSLSQLPNLKVMSRDTAFRFKGKEADPRTVGREMGVNAIVKGTVTQRGEPLSISAELIRARDNSHIWGQQYERKLTDMDALREEIAGEMASALRVRLTGPEEKGLTRTYTANPEAYQDYLKGRYWWNKSTPEGFDKGIEYFQQAIAKDPSYALAFSGLADCYSSLAETGLAPFSEGYLKAKDAALKAVELDDNLPEAHGSLALVKSSYDWDWSGADKEIRRAIELNPSYTDAHRLHAEILWQTGRLDEAIAEMKRSLELDPLSIDGNATLGAAFFLARQYDRAIEQEAKTLELDPNFGPAYYFRGVAYSKKSMYEQGMAEFDKLVAIAPDNPGALTGLGYGYAVTGRRADAQKVLDKLNELSKHEYVSPVWRAKIYAGLEEKDMAFEWLEKAYEDRSIVSVGYIKPNPMFDPLRTDRRYADLLRRTNLQP
jgi:TolB-like protein/DNA-binding winged helix-turn-helix (wHTH) protein/Tfp pilus assembly protein PilF